MQIDKDVLTILKSTTESNTEIQELFSRRFPEGTLAEDWKYGTISFYDVKNNQMIQVFPPDEDFEDWWRFQVVDSEGKNLIDKSTLEGIADLDGTKIDLKSSDWSIAKDKIIQILNANPTVKEQFKDFNVPDKAVDLMLKWNKLKSAEQDPIVVFRIFKV